MIQNSKSFASEHFTIEELQCKCGCGLMKVQQRAIEILERARVLYNKPIHIASAFRCAKRNFEIGGKPGSAHLTGWAFDPIKPEGGEDTWNLLQAFIKAGFFGFGYGNGKIHFDIDPVHGPRSWTYP